MNKVFTITATEYSKYVKYFSLMDNSQLLEIANFKVKNYLKDNSISNIDLFLESCNCYYYDIFYLDFFSKFFFKKSFIRFKFNLIVALHESDYENFNNMVNNSTITKILLDILKFVFIFITSPLWLIYKLLKSKIK
jgi:hypothetical protein